MNTFDYPPTLYDRRNEVFALIPAYHPLTVLYRSSVMAMTMLCRNSTEPLSRYQELSLALREQVCQDAYAWSEHLFRPGFTDWASARRLDNIFPGENSADYIGLASGRDDALGDLSAELYPHPLMRTQMDLMDAVRVRLQAMEGRVSLLLGYRDRAKLQGDPNPEYNAWLDSMLLLD